MILSLLLLITLSEALSETVVDVTKFGADPKGSAKSTDAIKKAVEEAASKGGGTVFFPKGQYYTGAIALKSGVTLHFDDKVSVKFSTDRKDYPAMEVRLPEGTQKVAFTPLISAFGQNNIGVKGKAILEGQGSAWWDKYQTLDAEITPFEVTFRAPPFMHFFDCKGITLEDFTLKNSPMWNVNPVQSDDITIKGITIDNPYKSQNTDGINCYSCRNLHISGVHISTGDDCVALDAGKKHPTQNVVITGSHMLEGHSGVGIGSAISGGLKNITVTDCVFDGTDRGLYIKSMRGRGGTVEDIHYRNISMNNIKKEGIVLSMLYDASHQDVALRNKNIKKEPMSNTTPIFRNLEYTGVKGSSNHESIFFVGLPESPIQNIKMSGIDVKSKSGVFLNNTKNVEINGKIQHDNSF